LHRFNCELLIFNSLKGWFLRTFFVKNTPLSIFGLFHSIFILQ
jgi:hypothetical protein